MNKVADINTRLADERDQRLRRIKLIERETAENEPIWKAKQATLYPTAVPISQTPTLGQVITEEIQKNALNSDVLYQRAEQKLSQLADKTNTEYILDRMEDDELYFLVNNWDGFQKDLKEKYSTKQWDKNIFIALVKKNADDIKNQFQGIKVDDLTARGKVRKQQDDDRLKDIQDKIDDDDAKDEAERKRKGDLRNQQVADEEAQKKADRDARRQTLEQSPAFKALARAKADKIKARIAKQDAEAAAKAKAEADAIAQAQAQAQADADARAQAMPMIEDEITRLNIIDDDPFADKTKPLYGSFKEDFTKDDDNLKSLFSYLTDSQFSDIYDDLNLKYPNKLASAKGNSAEAKVKNFLKQSTLDKYLGLQEETQKKSVDAFNRRLSQKSDPYDQRMAELGNMKLNELKPIALEKTGKSTYKTKADIVKAILMKEFPGKTGNGLKRRIVGKGMEGVNEAKKSKETVMKKIINGKYIDLNKLKNNIICIRYCKTRALVPNVKVQHISNGVKEIIDDIINDKFEKRLYEKLDMNEKRLVKRIVDSLKLDLDLHSKEEEEYVRQYEVVLGAVEIGKYKSFDKK